VSNRSIKPATDAVAKRGFCDRRKQTLFIDARKLGTLIDRVMGSPLLRS
jgi:hypothetical protein